jgi:hypothetical protein
VPASQRPACSLSQVESVPADGRTDDQPDADRPPARQHPAGPGAPTDLLRGSRPSRPAEPDCQEQYDQEESDLPLKTTSDGPRSSDAELATGRTQSMSAVPRPRWPRAGVPPVSRARTRPTGSAAQRRVGARRSAEHAPAEAGAIPTSVLPWSPVTARSCAGSGANPGGTVWSPRSPVEGANRGRDQCQRRRVRALRRPTR